MGAKFENDCIVTNKLTVIDKILQNVRGMRNELMTFQFLVAQKILRRESADTFGFVSAFSNIGRRGWEELDARVEGITKLL